MFAGSNVTLGQQLADTPDIAYVLSLNHAAELGNGGGLDTTLTYSYTDQFLTSQTVENAILVPDTGLFNARIKYTAPNGRWAVTLAGTNLADEVYSQGGQFYAGARGFVSLAFMARPREYALGFEYYSR